MNPITQVCVTGFVSVLFCMVGFAVGWYLGREEGMDDMAREIDRRMRGAK